MIIAPFVKIYFLIDEIRSKTVKDKRLIELRHILLLKDSAFNKVRWTGRRKRRFKA